MEKELKIGVITTTHGVKGEVKVLPLTDDAERYKKIKKLRIRTNGVDKDAEIQSVKFFKQFVILKFKGMDNANDVLHLRGSFLYIDRADGVPLYKDEYYIADLIGMEIITDKGESFGFLEDVMDTGANDVYVIQSKEHGQVLIPAIKDCILNVDISTGKMTVHLLEGLI